jgi:catechol 2,3-dioxygenase-like lactoylglutathione lyase family enzyme
MVRDMAKSIEWYESVMGMSVWMNTDFTLSGEGLATGNAGDKTHLVIMKCEDDVIGMIGLLQWVDPPMPAPDEIPTSITFGNPTFVVATDDAQATHDAAVALGTHIHSSPRDWSTTGQDGRTKHFVGISLFDPDGYFFECNQLLRIGD